MKEEIKVKLVKRVPMSNQGISHWGRRLRNKISRKVFKSLKSQYVNVKDIDTRKKILDFIWCYGGDSGEKGEIEWYLTAPCHAKNRFKVSYKALCKVKLEPTKDGNYNVVEWKDFRLKRYSWFFKRGE